MKEETKSVIQKVSLGMVLVGSIGAIATGLTSADVSMGITIAEGVVSIVGGIIAFIFNKK
ncbi:MAG: hypothetical protein MJZ03_03420 [archaeon]|nr:hypothetical protein [archaeon]